MIGRLRTPDLVAAAGGFALLVSMFLHWYGLVLPGGPEVTAWQAYSVLDAYLYGFALQEKSVPFEDAQDVTAVAKEQVDAYDAFADYPYLAEVVAGHVAEVGYDFASSFETGLDLILDALERLRTAG